MTPQLNVLRRFVWHPFILEHFNKDYHVMKLSYVSGGRWPLTRWLDLYFAKEETNSPLMIEGRTVQTPHQYGNPTSAAYQPKFQGQLDFSELTPAALAHAVRWSRGRVSSFVQV